MIKGCLLQKCGNLKYENPAIVIKNVRVSDLRGNVFPESFDGMVDTGADKSVVPLRVCRALGLPILDSASAVGFDGAVRHCSIYWIYLKVEGIEDIPLKVIAVHRGGVLLGRDFLRNMLLAMDNRAFKYGIGANRQWKALSLKLMRIL